MRFKPLLCALALLSALCTSASAEVYFRDHDINAVPHSMYIDNEGDNGGRILEYVYFFTLLAKVGGNVYVDGPCASACTLMLGIVPLRNIHLTGNARFIFHEPYSVGLFGSTQTDPVATLQFTQLYPEWVRGALLRKGGLNGVDNYITLAGPELKTLFASAVRKKASGKTYEPIELFARTKKVLPAHVPLPKPRPKERPFSAHQLY